MTLAMPNKDRWSIVRAMFDAVSGLAATQRDKFLDFACPDASIRAEVESLLVADDSAGDWDLPSDRGQVTGTTEEPMPEIPGYRVESLLGSGGVGSVYAARNVSSGAMVAIKVVRSVGLGTQAVMRFRQECRALSRLSHPGIVRLIETGSAAGLTYLVMEFIDGLPLDAWLAEARRSPQRCIGLVRGMLDALAHAHDAGVVHRDLKPRNVVVATDGTPRLVDFGVARLTADDGRRTGYRTETGHLVGTFAYMSPEQADGRSDRIGAASDVYQAALLLFEMLAGRLPYDTDGRSGAGLLRAVLFERRMRLDEIRPELGKALADLLDRALSIDVAQRPSSARAFEAELAAIKIGV
jgi:serine/threonine protein kinase